MGRNELKLENVTKNPKIPFGSCFYVVDTWEVKPLNEEGNLIMLT
jgi:hypothetical protein